MVELIMLGAAVGAVGAGYVNVRRFVRERLRFVDGVQRRGAPYAAGAIAALAAAPVVVLLPVVGGGTALLFGAAVGLGVARGARDIRGSLSLPEARGIR
jgi:hypothetical protein